MATKAKMQKIQAEEYEHFRGCYMLDERVSRVEWICLSSLHVKGIINGLFMNTDYVSILVRSRVLDGLLNLAGLLCAY